MGRTPEPREGGRDPTPGHMAALRPHVLQTAGLDRRLNPLSPRSGEMRQEGAGIISGTRRACSTPAHASGLPAPRSELCCPPGR